MASIECVESAFKSLAACRCLVLAFVVAWSVTLTADDRDELMRIIVTGFHPVSMIRRARVLLAPDDSLSAIDPKR